MGQEKPGDQVPVAEAERLLKMLLGVDSAKVVINDWGAIEEIHVVATTERHPKQVVRDVESALAARWGIRVDHKKISVAQLRGLDPTLPPMRLRPLRTRLVSDSLKNALHVTVELCKSDDEEAVYEGQAEGLNAGHYVLRTVGRATAEALNRYLLPSYSVCLDQIDRVKLGGDELVVAVVSLITPQGNSERLIGAVPAGQEPHESAVAAVLDACNRRLGRLGAKRKKVRLKEPEQTPDDFLPEDDYD